MALNHLEFTDIANYIYEKLGDISKYTWIASAQDILDACYNYSEIHGNIDIKDIVIESHTPYGAVALADVFVKDRFLLQVAHYKQDIMICDNRGARYEGMILARQGM